MFNMTQQEVIEILKTVDAIGPFGFVAVTEERPLKKSRITKGPVPHNLRHVTIYKIGVVSAGHDYEAEVRKQREREGKDPNAFVAEGTYAKKISDNNLIYEYSGDNPALMGRHYVRIFPTLGSYKQAVVIKDADGNTIDRDAWVAIRDEFFKLKPAKNEKQGTETEVEVRMYGLQNVKYLKSGEVLINEITEEIAKITVPAIKAA